MHNEFPNYLDSWVTFQDNKANYEMLAYYMEMEFLAFF